tara:strand:+ start:5141 stop:5743 length:603 start_codon:yes stop_codon:yes gene_type:complete
MSEYDYDRHLTPMDADVAAFIRTHPVLHEAIGFCADYMKQQIIPRIGNWWSRDVVEISQTNFVKECNLQDCFGWRNHTTEPEYAPNIPPAARYVVCRGEHEVFDRVLEKIRESMHHMTPSFVASYTAEGIDEEIIKVLQPLYQPNIIYQVLAHPQERTLRDLVEEAIRLDGAAHFLASYDGEEIEIPSTDGETCYIYRRD